MIFLRTNWPNFVYKVTFYVGLRADLPERFSISVPAVINNIYRYGSKTFAGTAFVQPHSGITKPLTVRSTVSKLFTK